MGLFKVAQTFDVRLPLGLKGWQAAMTMAATIILAPVIAMVLLFLFATLIPVLLPLLATLFARFWLSGRHSALPSTPVRPPHVLGPRMSHALRPLIREYRP